MVSGLKGCTRSSLRYFLHHTHIYTYIRTYFMAKWIVAEKNEAGLRHAVACPNVTGRTKERIAQSKRARALVRSPLPCWLTTTSGANLGPSGVWFANRCHDVFLWCYLCFVLLCFVFRLIEAAALRSIILPKIICRRPDSHTFLFLFLRCRFFRVFFVPLFPLYLVLVYCIESTSYVLSFRMVFFYLVTTGWIFGISLLCENSTNQSINNMKVGWRGTGLSNPSRETKHSGANADRKIFIFPCSADHEQDWQPYLADAYSCYMCDHTCMVTHTCSKSYKDQPGKA